jgi:hypothetical protein
VVQYEVLRTVLKPRLLVLLPLTPRHARGGPWLQECSLQPAAVVTLRCVVVCGARSGGQTGWRKGCVPGLDWRESRDPPLRPPRVATVLDTPAPNAHNVGGEWGKVCCTQTHAAHARKIREIHAQI